MRFLIDECLSPDLVALAQGFDATRVVFQVVPAKKAWFPCGYIYTFGCEVLYSACELRAGSPDYN